jgi:DNA repair protein RadC
MSIVYKSLVPELTIKRNKTDFKKVKVDSSKTAEQFIRQFYHDDMSIYESFFILLLNRSNNTVGWAKIAQGGVASVSVDIKIIAKYAVDSLASAVILAHNHPSGQTKPSQSDINLTKKVKEALTIFDCQVLDHIILTEDEFYSFADESIL